jgi:exodeoxyribonuclease VII small subunit
MAKAKATYESLQAELDQVLFDLQRDDLGVDKAVACYQRGLELIKELEAYLTESETKIHELKLKLTDAA